MVEVYHLLNKVIKLIITLESLQIYIFLKWLSEARYLFIFYTIFLTRSSGRYAALLLAPAEGWWPSATYNDPLGPPNDLWFEVFRFFYFNGSFLSMIFEFGKFRKLFWNQWAYLGRVCFLTFCDLKLFFGFWILRGHFLVWFLSFENRDQKHKWSLDNFEGSSSK